MDTVEPTRKRKGKFTWFGLNADGVLVALLALLAGFDLISPQQDEVVNKFGYIPGIFYVWTFCLVYGGISLLWGFTRMAVGPEMLGRTLLVFGAALKTFTVVLAFGGLDPLALKWYTITFCLIFLLAFRLISMLSASGVVVVIKEGTYDEPR